MSSSSVNKKGCTRRRRRRRRKKQIYEADEELSTIPISAMKGK